MTSSANEKRLDKIETQLTPKEWAIREADENRKYPSMEAMLLRPPSEIWKNQDKALAALKQQSEEKYPGKKPEDNRARYQYYREIWTEFQFLRFIMQDVRDTIIKTNVKTGLKAALKLSRLETIILQDSFGRTARKAAEWIELFKTEDKDDEENRQIMLKELSAYTDADLGEKWSDSVPLPGGVRVRFPSVIENWVETVVALTADVYAQRHAVQTIQDKYFDGHPFLFLDIETEMNETIKTLEEGIETFNTYLKTRSEIFKADWEDEEQEEDGIASAIPGEREGKLAINLENLRRGSKKMSNEVVESWTKQAIKLWAMSRKKLKESEANQLIGYFKDVLSGN